MTSALARAADDGLRVMEHLGHRDPHGRLVAEQHLPERVADEEHRDAGFVEDLGGRVVVRGEHRDALAIGVHPGDVRDGQAADRVGRGTHASSVRAGSLDQSALTRRERPALGRAGRGGGRRPPAWCSSGRSSRPPSASRIVTRLVSVPKPEPGSATSLATSRSMPLRWSLSARPIERSGLGRETDEDRRDGRIDRHRAGPRAIATRRGCRGSIRGSSDEACPALELVVAGDVGRKSATAAAMTSASNPAAPSRSRARSRSAALSSSVESTRTTATAAGSGTSMLAATIVTARPAIERGFGDRDAHLAGRAVADEPDRIDRLARAARASRRRAGPSRSASRSPRHVAVVHAASGARTGRSADGRDDPVHDRRQIREPADARLARGELAGIRLDDLVSEVIPEASDVRPCRGMRPHVAVHRRSHDDWRSGREDRRGDDVTRQAGRHRAKPVRGGRRDDDGVGAVGDDDVPDPAVRQQARATSVSTGWRDRPRTTAVRRTGSPPA